MQFLSLGEELEIRLSERDAVRLGLDFDSFDYEKKTSRHLLEELVEAARAETGFSVRQEDWVVHLYRRRDGGLSFLLRAKNETEKSSVCLCFWDFAALLAARRQGVLQGHSGQLLREGEAFYLRLFPAADLSEYAEVISSRAFAALARRAKECDTRWLFGKEEQNG